MNYERNAWTWNTYEAVSFGERGMDWKGDGSRRYASSRPPTHTVCFCEKWNRERKAFFSKIFNSHSYCMNHTPLVWEQKETNVEWWVEIADFNWLVQLSPLCSDIHHRSMHKSPPEWEVSRHIDGRLGLGSIAILIKPYCWDPGNDQT